MIIKTQAIALNIWPFSESSHIVSWLTADHGKIATIIKGAQRPRNIFLGQYDLFYTCELLFYLRLFQGLHIVKECSPLKPRSAFRSYWPGTACASYFAGLTAKIAPFYAPQRNLYTLLETALDFFAEEQNLEIGLFWFELKLLGVMGYAPRLDACLQCHRPLAPAGSPRRSLGGAPPASEREPVSIIFSAARGGALCGKCAGQNRETSGRIAPDSLALLRFWQSSRNIHAIRNVVCSERQIRDVGTILGSFLQHHLETENTGREAAFSILRERRKLTCLARISHRQKPPARNPLLPQSAVADGKSFGRRHWRIAQDSPFDAPKPEGRISHVKCEKCGLGGLSVQPLKI